MPSAGKMTTDQIYRLASENGFDLVAQVALDGTYLFASPNHLEAIGYSPAELVGTNVLQKIHPDDVGVIAENWEAMIAERSGRADFRFRHRDGHWMWFVAAGRLVKDESGQSSFISVSRDISARKRRELELEVLAELAKAINSGLERQGSLDQVAELLRPLLPFDDIFVTTLRDGALRLFAGHFKEGHAAFPGLTREESLGAPMWDALENGELYFENNWSYAHDSRVGSFINIPIRVEGQPVGMLHLDSERTGIWTPEHVKFAGLVGEQLAVIIWQANSLERSRWQEAALAQSNALLLATHEAAADGICLVDDRGQVVSFNRRFAELWGLEAIPSPHPGGLGFQGEGWTLTGEHRGSVTAGAGISLMAHVLMNMAEPDEFIEKIGTLFDDPEASSRDEVRLVDGRVLERFSAPAKAPDGRSFGRVWSFVDISDRKRYEERLTHQAFHDAVTGLPNRLLFVDRLSRALVKLGRSQRMVAVLFLDLDRFKVVNDTLGHDIGDRLLVEVAQRLEQSLRPGDTAARFGGDEFVVLLDEVVHTQDATRVAERIAHNLLPAFHLGGQDVHVTASIGIALSETSATQPDELLRKADVAMYRAKARGRAHFEIFSEEISERALERLQMELELAGAIKRGELELYYQPLIDLLPGQVSGFEALVRWMHPEHGIIGPDVFIPIAEEVGLIVPIGSWVLRTACDQARQWTEHFGTPFNIHVNLSSRQFEQRKLPAEVARILAEMQLSPSQLVLEITESAVMQDPDSAMDQLRQLRKLGVRLAIDDFGTGYSSLSHLEFLPIDILKIDRSFTARLSEGSAVVKAVAMLGEAMNVEVAAEGIETAEELAQLRALHVRWGQGFLFSRPVPADQAARLLSMRY